MNLLVWAESQSRSRLNFINVLITWELGGGGMNLLVWAASQSRSRWKVQPVGFIILASSKYLYLIIYFVFH